MYLPQFRRSHAPLIASLALSILAFSPRPALADAAFDLLASGNLSVAANPDGLDIQTVVGTGYASGTSSHTWPAEATVGVSLIQGMAPEQPMINLHLTGSANSMPGSPAYAITEGMSFGEGYLISNPFEDDRTLEIGYRYDLKNSLLADTMEDRAYTRVGLQILEDDVPRAYGSLCMDFSDFGPSPFAINVSDANRFSVTVPHGESRLVSLKTSMYGSATSIPEPGSMALLLSGLAPAAVAMRRRRK